VTLQFGDLVFNPDTRQLLRAGVEIRLSPKAFELFASLVESRPRALSKAELMERLWPATYVAESNLASLVAEIREAIGDDARTPTFVRTLPRFGYAFCGTAMEKAVDPMPPRPTGLGYWVVWDARQIPLRQGENIVGREPEAAVWIDSAAVSRRHARITIAGIRAHVEDLGSKNGTYVRGTRIKSVCEVVDGDEIRIGSVVLQFRMPSSAGSTVSLT
jgi:DNA-binding winged helix-turn-helix (wHTH) protein